MFYLIWLSMVWIAETPPWVWINFQKQKSNLDRPWFNDQESCLLDQLIKGICHSRIVSGWTWVSTVSPEWKVKVWINWKILRLGLVVHKVSKHILVGGWTNPLEKYESKWVHLPQIGVKIIKKIKNIWNHHLDIPSYQLMIPVEFWRFFFFRGPQVQKM